MSVNKLRGKMVSLDVSMEEVAKVLGVTVSSMYRKLNSFEKITIGEAKKIKEFLGLTDAEAIEIFLS